MQVPFLDLRSQYNSIKEEIHQALEEVISSQQFILGEVLEKFEEEIARFIGSKYAIGVASGSDALLLSLMALKIGPGDEVITTPYSFFATAGAIVRLGARVVFVDIEPDTFNIDPARVAEYLEKDKKHRVKAILPVHLFGQCADMDSLMKLSRQYRVPIIEDAAQAIGSLYNNQHAGTFGLLGCFSFYPTKNLGGWGDGGLITTNNDSYARLIKMLRVHGAREKYYHTYVGINSRLDALQAAVLRVKLKYLNQWNTRRIQHAERYYTLFQQYQLEDRIILPKKKNNCYHTYHQYTIRVPRKRDELKNYLKENKIGVEIYYPQPLHLQVCFKSLGYKKGDLPVSEKMVKESLSLPIYPELTETMQEYVVSKIAEFFSKK